MDDVDAIVITEGQRIPADNVFIVFLRYTKKVTKKKEFFNL